MKGSTNKKSKLPIETVNIKKQAKIDKKNGADDVAVVEDENGVRITFNGGVSWVGIRPVMARKISADLLRSATNSEKLKKDKLAKVK